MSEYKYCPTCKGDLETYDQYWECLSCHNKIYKNSKPTAAVLPISDGKVLITKRAFEPFKGKLDIIGGFLNNGELPQEGAIREAKEETGLDVEIINFLGIYIDRYGENDIFTLNICYVAKITGGEMQAQDDVAELLWIPIEELQNVESFPFIKLLGKDLVKWYEENKDKI